MEIKDLCTLIEENDDERRGVHFPLTDIYNEGWLLRLALSKGLVQKQLPCELCEKWFSEAQLKSPFLHGKKRENRTHADAVIGSFKIEENTATGVEIDIDDFSCFYAIEAKMFAPLSKGISSCEDYNQATRYIGCLAKMASDVELCEIDDFKKLGLFVITPKSQHEKIKENLDKKIIRPQLNDRIEKYGEENDTDSWKKWKKWWDKHGEDFLKNIKIEQINWEQIVDDELKKGFYKKCKEYNDPKRKKENLITK